MEKIIKQEIPKSQLKIIQNGLEAMRHTLKLLPKSDEIAHLDFDLLTLTSLLNYKVSVELTDKEHNSFTFDNGIDFPEYI